MLPKAHLTLHSKMPGFEWVITSLYLSGSLRSFLYSSSKYSCHLYLIFFISVRSLIFLPFIVTIFVWNIPLISLIFLKWSLVFPILLISSISLHCSLRKAFFSLFAILWNSAFRWLYLPFSPLAFTSPLSYLQSFLRQPFGSFVFLFLGDGFDHHLLCNVTNLHSWFFRHSRCQM